MFDIHNIDTLWLEPIEFRKIPFMRLLEQDEVSQISATIFVPHHNLLDTTWSLTEFLKTCLASLKAVPGCQLSNCQACQGRILASDHHRYWPLDLHDWQSSDTRPHGTHPVFHCKGNLHCGSAPATF